VEQSVLPWSRQPPGPCAKPDGAYESGRFSINVLFWLAADQARYQVASGLIAGAFVLVTLAGLWSPRVDAWLGTRAGRLVFAGLALLVLLAGRWPSLFVRDTLNEDEAQALAQAITALRDPIPWRSFDGNTCGPLNTYILMLPALAGAKLTFLTARATAVGLQWFDALALAFCVERIFIRPLARIAMVPGILFFSMTDHPEWVHYTGEQVSIALSMAALATLCFAYRRGFAAVPVGVVGLFIGAMPFAKLQSVPLGAGLAGIAILALILTRHAARIAALVAGCAIVPAIVLSAAALGGTLADFWHSYIRSALGYILYDYPPIGFFTATDGFGPLFDVLCAFGIAGCVTLLVNRGRVSKLETFGLLAAVAIFAAAVYTIDSPRRTTLNYLTFAVFPASGFAIAGLAVMPRMPRQALATVLALACSVIAPIAFREPYPYLPSVTDYNDPEPLTALLLTHVSPGERMAIWGWRAKYYVYTQALMGTRDAITRYQWDPDFNPERPYFRARYLRDFARNRPVAFLDAGVDSFGPDGRHEAWPQLDAIVRRDFRYVGAVDGNRLYLRRHT